MSFQHIGIVGAGSWGTALAVLVNENRVPVTVWGHNAKHIAEVAAARENTAYLPGVALPESLRFSSMRGQCVAAIRQFARGRWQDANVRKLVLLDLKGGLGEGLDQYVERIVDAPDQIKRLRLRDGRWVS